MLYQRILKSGAQLTEEDLRAIAKAAYDELLVELCTRQRSRPYQADVHSAANLGLADYYERLADHGGRMSLLPAEERRLTEQGWDHQRIADLRSIVKAVEEGGQTKLNHDYIDDLLLRQGIDPDDRSRWMTELALYPAFRDAHLDAQLELERMIGPAPAIVDAPVTVLQAAAAPVPVEVAAPAPAGDRRAMSDFVEEAISDLVVEDIWDAKSGRQARSTVALFELLIGKKSFATYTQADFATFKRKTRYLPSRYDMTSPKSRAEVLKIIAAREQDPEFQKKGNKEVRSNRTRNRHISSLKGIHRWAKKNGLDVPAIDFEGLFIFVSKATRGRKLRAATPKDDVGSLFALPVFVGCLPHLGGTGQKVLRARFSAGTVIVHDAFYWVPLLIYYTGARREEICKLRPQDVFFVNGIAYIFIDFTEFGRLKNDHSVRPVPLHSELLRLGFREFVEECRARDYDVLFPELRPTNTVQVFGDVYYKTVWSHLKDRAGLTTEATNHGMRHRFATDLKAKKVFSEFRRDLMGHAGANLNEEIYSDTGPLLELRAVVQELPSVTDHLSKAPLNVPPRAMRRPQPKKRRNKS